MPFLDAVRGGTLAVRIPRLVPCEDCGGGGRRVERRELEVEIPAGIHDGQQIRLTGEGHHGAPGGRPGDAYVQVRVRPDDRFVREGNDIFSRVDLTMVQAALGAKVARTHAGLGDAASFILEVAAREHPDVIVVGKRGRGRLSGLLLGSVSQKLVTLAQCNVLVVP